MVLFFTSPVFYDIMDLHIVERGIFMCIINHLLLGDCFDLLYAAPKSDEYRRLTKTIDTAEKSFLAELNKSQKAKYEECVSLLLSREAVIIEEKAVLYFSLGARMMCEILSSGEKNQ